MKRILSIGLLSFALIAFAQTPVYADTSTWQKGASMFPLYNTHLSETSTKQSLQNLRATGANYVSFIIPYKQGDRWSTTVYPAHNTPTDESLIEAINFAHSIGLKVMLKPHLETEWGEWRANINPGDRDAWFTSYGNMLEHYARIAEAHGVEDICIGTELIGMSSPSSNGTNTEQWNRVISNLRNIYGGKLTYSANWTDEVEKIEFWGSLDYIGVSAYYELWNNDGSVESLKNNWNQWAGQYITSTQQKFNKPVVFTEVGYRSINGSYNQPWNWERGGSYDETAQANAYEALFSYWNQFSYFQGVQLWHWLPDPNAGGNGNLDYTPQHKRAESVMRTWFGGSGGSTTTPPTNPPSSITSQATAATGASVGQSNNLTATVNLASGSLSNAIVDIEVRNSSGTKIFQKFFEGQNLTAGSKTYTAAWTPQAAGTYNIVVGVFNSTWTTGHHWNPTAGNVTVQNGGTTPPPSSGTNMRIGLQSPTHNSHISGITTFRASMPYIAITKYNLTWQVDGGPATTMTDNYEGYAHKSSVVDVSGWNWNGDGPYRLTFTAKNSQGTTISQQNISIFVDR